MTLTTSAPLYPWIGGAPRATATTLAVLDPATGLPIAEVGDTDPADATAAVDAAAAALPGWAATAARARSECLARAFALMRAEAEDLARLITSENGKALADARAEVAYAAEFLRWFAEEAVRIPGVRPGPAGGVRTIVTHRPVGVCALVTPWNFPAAMATRKIAPALAAGCTVVLKPAAETPLTALALAELLQGPAARRVWSTSCPPAEPAELVSRLLADRAGPQDLVHRLDRRRAGCCCARPRTAWSTRRWSSAATPRSSCSPTPTSTPRWRRARREVPQRRPGLHGGQPLPRPRRRRRRLHRALRRGGRAAARRAGMRRGHGDRPAHLAGRGGGVAALVDDAVAAGAMVAYRATDVPPEGYFYPPTVLRDVPASARILRCEVFGPVAPIVTWTSEQELLGVVDDTEYGLTGYLYSRDAARAMWLAEQMDIGMVAVNRGVVSDPAAPFGGTRQSGLGREGGRAGIEAFLETQYLSLDWPQDRPVSGP